MLKNREKRENGITIIALIITIVILIIFAGVAIATLTQTGVLENAKQAKNIMKNAQIDENTILESYGNKVNEITGKISGDRDDNSEFKELIQEKISKLEK